MFRIVRNFSRICRIFPKQQQLFSQQYTSKQLLTQLRVSAYRPFSSQADRQFSEVLTEEIKQEHANSLNCKPPSGFTVSKEDTTIIHLQKTFPDGVTLGIEMDLAGSIAPEDLDDEEPQDKKEEEPISSLAARPDFKLKLTKQSGKAVMFHCSFPTADEKSNEDSKSSDLLDMVEMESVPGYFVHTDLFDDNMYDHIMRLLTERGVDLEFQRQLQDFATSEEHKLYQSFLGEFKEYCKE